ncbi:MAG: class III signal peptide-containing protein [Candidatus Omnitrophica bacterium]|nr:class III signal peptide-containing protein [Candidatus Omnitrophota bacterium]
MIRHNLKSGQSTIEYILLVTAVVVVAIALTAKNGVMEQSVNKVLKMPGKSLERTGLVFINRPN